MTEQSTEPKKPETREEEHKPADQARPDQLPLRWGHPQKVKEGQGPPTKKRPARCG